MKPARIVILATALVAGIAAAWMVAGSKPPPPVRVVSAPRVAPMDNVLVAAKEIAGAIQEGDLRWQPWPKNGVPSGAIREADKPDAITYFKGFCVRDKTGPGVPLRTDLLSPPVQGCNMAATLPEGERAVAINIDAQGATTAGGFIRPGDHVDVIHTFKDPSGQSANGASDGMASETILRNVKVLAIGPNDQQQGDQRVVSGSNATLELTPVQVEKIVLAQRIGQLTLSLRSMADTGTAEPNDSPPPQQSDFDMTVVRFGVPTTVHFSLPTPTQAY
jgi:pilus assembly protein CpaB